LLSPTWNWLIIGYGNTLRGDDGVGYVIAETVADWNLTGVRSLAVHQLTPDLARVIAQSEQLLLIDAVVPSATPNPTVTIEPLTIDYSQTFTGHFADPGSLLAIAQMLYDYAPTTYRLLIPTVSFEFGEQFSTVTQSSMALALDKIKQLVVPSSDNR